ncbi:MAG TPA: YggS family pyridoxal phosphate-dependent enzyme [Pseudomonadales bacterium]
MTPASTLDAISPALADVRARIEKSEREYARLPGSVQLLAVSKTHAAAAVQRAYEAGQRHFGENYLQEALAKIEQLPADITWHFIGPIQSNKTRPLAERFDWVHTVDREKVARRLDEQRPADKVPLNVLLQVNVSGEASKSGASLDELPALAAVIGTLPRLRLRGLMAIPAPTADIAKQRAAFRQLADARTALVAAGHASCTELSMGMSQDMEAAIAEGATMVRVGTDIFGARPAK